MIRGIENRKIFKDDKDRGKEWKTGTGFRLSPE
jgi:hypothetical protein